MSSKRYYPGLLSAEHRVLADYFQGSAYLSTEQNRSKELAVAAGILLLVGSLFTLAYLPFFLVLAVTGLILLPGIGRMVAHAFRIRLTSPVRKITVIALLALNLPFAVAFGGVKSRLAAVNRAELLREQKVAEQIKRAERQRKDSLDVCLQRITVFHEQGETNKALVALDKADLLTKTSWESADVNQKRIEVSRTKVAELITKRQYNMAIDLLNDLHELDTNDAGILYQRALCFAETDRIPNAVRDAKRAMARGHKDAGELYEKINPVRQRLAYRTTLCNDGTFSGATGRGACSHHGGVDTWNYPVYEDYRQYE